MRRVFSPVVVTAATDAVAHRASDARNIVRNQTDLGPASARLQVGGSGSALSALMVQDPRSAGAGSQAKDIHASNTLTDDSPIQAPLP